MKLEGEILTPADSRFELLEAGLPVPWLRHDYANTMSYRQELICWNLNFGAIFPCSSECLLLDLPVAH